MKTIQGGFCNPFEELDALQGTVLVTLSNGGAAVQLASYGRSFIDKPYASDF